MHCTNCGAELVRDGANFCLECGEPVEEDTESSNEIQQENDEKSSQVRANTSDSSLDIRRENAESAIDFTRIAGGLSIGVLAFVSGYLITYGILLLIGNPASIPFSTSDWVGLVFYGAHNVPVTIDGDQTVARGGITYIFTLLIPVVLVFFGMVIKRIHSYRGSKQPLFGATVGYFVCSLFARVLFNGTTTDGSEVQYSLNLFETVFVMGIVYPLLLLGLGIFLSFVVWPDTDE